MAQTPYNPPEFSPPGTPLGGQNLGAYVGAGQLATQVANDAAHTLNYGPIECLSLGNSFQAIGGKQFGTAPVFYNTRHDLALSIPTQNMRQGIVTVSGSSVLSGTGPVINQTTGQLGDTNLATIYNEIQIVGVIGGVPQLLTAGSVGLLSQLFMFGELESNTLTYRCDESEPFDSIDIYSAIHIGIGVMDNVNIVSMPINVTLRFWSK